MTDTRARVLITAEDRASEVLRRLGSTVDKAQTSFERINTPLLRFQTLWASLVGGAVVSGFRSLVSSIDDLDEAAQGLGTTAVELSNLRIAAGEAGVSAEAFDTALTRLNVSISNAATGSKEQAALFKALGISIRDAAGNVRPTTQVLAEISDKFATLEDGPAKAALAVDLFGKAGAKLVPLLNQGSAGLEKFSGLTDDTVRATRELQGEFDRLNANVDRFTYGIAGAAVPAVNTFLEALGRINPSAVAASFIGNSPVGALTRVFSGLTIATNEQLNRQRQVREALRLGEGAYSNEGRQALQNAQAIRDKAAADAAATTASRKKTGATNESSNAYAKEFADIARIRAARERFDQEQEDAANRERERREQRAEDLTGRSTARQQAEDLAILREEFEKGNLEAIEYEIRKAQIFGRGNDVETGLERQTELAEQLGLTMASSLGELITAGGRAGDVWKALGQDILKLVTQMLILKPLAEELKKTFEGWGLGGGRSSGAGLFEGLFKGAFGAFAGGAGTGQNADGSWGFVGASGSGTVHITNYIDGALDRSRIASYVETGVKAGLAQSWDNVARGGSGVIG